MDLIGGILLNNPMGDLSITKLIGVHQRASFRIQQDCLVVRCWEFCAWRLDTKPFEKKLGLYMYRMLCCWVGNYVAIAIYIGAQQTGIFN